MQKSLLVSTTPFKPALQRAFKDAGWSTVFCTAVQLDEVLPDLSEGDLLLVNADQPELAEQLRLAGTVAPHLRVLLLEDAAAPRCLAVGYARPATMIAPLDISDCDLVGEVSGWMGQTPAGISISLWDVLETARLEKLTCELLFRTPLGVSGAMELRDGRITSAGSRERMGSAALPELNGELVGFDVLPLNPVSNAAEPLDVRGLPEGKASPDAAAMLAHGSGLLGVSYRAVHALRSKGERSHAGQQRRSAPSARLSVEQRLRRIEDASMNIEEPETDRFTIDEPETLRLDLDASGPDRWDIDEPDTIKTDSGRSE